MPALIVFREPGLGADGVRVPGLIPMLFTDLKKNGLKPVPGAKQVTGAVRPL